VFETEIAFRKSHYSHSRFSQALAQRLSFLILLLVVALMTTSCRTVAQAAGTQNSGTPNNLNLYGNLRAGTVNQSYNAVLAVCGGSFPYYFSVKTGALAPGISLNPGTGTIPTTLNRPNILSIVGAP
jgi:hypothetical protein